MTDQVQQAPAQEPPQNPILCSLCHQRHPLLPESGPPYTHYECTTYNKTVTLLDVQSS